MHGTRVKSIADFIRILQQYEIGRNVTLGLLRGDRGRSVAVVVMDIS